MKEPAPSAMPDTRSVNYYAASTVLPVVLRRWLCGQTLAFTEDACRQLGSLAANELEDAAHMIDRHPPQLHPYNKRGERLDEIEFHSAWQTLVNAAYCQFGIAAMSHRQDIPGFPKDIPEVSKYALMFLFAHADRSVTTGISMTDILARVLRMYAPHLAAKFVPLLTRTEGKPFQAAMFLTEKAGGSDVGANMLKATRSVEGDWILEGDKWFCSNCHADLILTLARPVGSTASGTAGLALFLVPRVLEDGQRNGYRVNRLKTKMGTRGLPSGEVTFEKAKAYLVGEPGQGFHQMTEMLNQTRVANAIVSAAIVHRSWFEAINHAIGRSAFGKRLSDHPLMMEVLSNLLVECEGLTRLSFFVASQVDRYGEGNSPAGLVARTLTPLAKYHSARLAQWASHEAMEVRGGNGYIEDWPNAMLVRDAHLLSIWEGSSNIMLLDTGRALKRAGAFEAVLHDVSERVEQIFHPRLKAIKRGLKVEIERFRELAIHAGVTRGGAKGGDEEIYLRPMTESLAHLYTTVLFAQDADVDLSEGDGRIALLTARYFLRHVLSDGSRTIDPTLRETFYDVVSGRWLDPIHAERLMVANEVQVER